jgi:hypothetical protein
MVGCPVRYRPWLWWPLSHLILAGSIAGLVCAILYGNKQEEALFEPTQCTPEEQILLELICTQCDSSDKKRCVDYQCYRTKCRVHLIQPQYYDSSTHSVTDPTNYEMANGIGTYGAMGDAVSANTYSFEEDAWKDLQGSGYCNMNQTRECWAGFYKRQESKEIYHVLWVAVDYKVEFGVMLAGIIVLVLSMAASIVMCSLNCCCGIPMCDEDQMGNNHEMSDGRLSKIL